MSAGTERTLGIEASRAGAGSGRGVAARARLVLVSQLFHPDAQAASQLFTDLLVALGDVADCEVLCGYPAGADAPRAPARERIGAVRILRCGLRVDGKRNLVMRLLGYGSFFLHALARLARRRDADVVLGVTSPPFLGLGMWLVSRLTGLSYDFIVLDAYPEALVSVGRLRPSSPLVRLWQWCNGHAYRRARRVIFIGRDMLVEHRTRYAIPPERCTYLPHWSPIEPRRRTSFEENELAKRLGLEDRFVVQYSGNMGLLHDLDTLIRAAEHLRSEERIKFLLIGRGMRRAAAERLSAQVGLDNVIWLDFFPREQLEVSLTCCHVGVISLREGAQGIAVPSKLYGILAAGRAVLAHVPADSEVARTVLEAGAGLVVAPGDSHALASAIQDLARDRARTETMGQRAFDAYRDRYTRARAVRELVRLWSDDAIRA